MFKHLSIIFLSVLIGCAKQMVNNDIKESNEGEKYLIAQKMLNLKGKYLPTKAEKDTIGNVIFQYYKKESLDVDRRIGLFIDTDNKPYNFLLRKDLDDFIARGGFSITDSNLIKYIIFYFNKTSGIKEGSDSIIVAKIVESYADVISIIKDSPLTIFLDSIQNEENFPKLLTPSVIKRDDGYLYSGYKMKLIGTQGKINLVLETIEMFVNFNGVIEINKTNEFYYKALVL